LNQRRVFTGYTTNEVNSGKWEGNEYLNLYPVMQRDEKDLEQVDGSKVTITRKDGENEVTLKQWLSS